jgi:hypothetical protein
MRSTTRRFAAPASDAIPTDILRTGLGLVVVVSLLAFAVRVQAQQNSTQAIHLRPVVGAIVATGDQRDAMKSAALVGAQEFPR